MQSQPQVMETGGMTGQQSVPSDTVATSPVPTQWLDGGLGMVGMLDNEYSDKEIQVKKIL